MKFCSSCGHELGVGRFCTNCGQAIDRSGAPPVPPAPPSTAPPVLDDAQTAIDERRAARRHAALTPGPARTPPAADDTPAPPRFPLYADEVEPEPWSGTATDLPPVSDELAGAPGYEPSYAADSPTTSLPSGGSLLDRFTDPTPTRTPEEAYAALHAAAEDDDVDGEMDGDDSPRRRWPWLVLVVVVLAAAVLIWLVSRGGASDKDGSARDSAGAAAAASLTSQVKVKTPGNAPPSQETSGEKATFVADNLLDGKPDTAWRVAGDARGKKIVFTFADQVTISQVGLINGYAKVAQGTGGRRFDWYHGNRTISKVAWVFDDGKTIQQDLARNRTMQTIDVDDITTKTLTLRLLAVSKPGTGRAGRDFTAISDVTLTGVPAS